MRDIRFRAWCPTKKQFVNPRFDNVELDVLFQLPFYQYQQFTGLKDKNGKEIYEGDIIAWSLKSRSTVVFEDGAFCADIANLPLGNLTGGYVRCEVVGNIHETPDLMETSK
jgi:uncharacterized phage protein (TIGR01671 family)